MEGNEQGTFSPTGCDDGWRMVECDDLPPCSSFGTCDECLRGARCGWCPSTDDRSDAVGCSSMELAERDSSEDSDGKTKAAPQWMPPQREEWCPGGSYQHKYKEQCTKDQPTKKEALINGKRRENVLRAQEYTNNLKNVGDKVRTELSSLLVEVQRAHDILVNEDADNNNNNNNNNTTAAATTANIASSSYYLSANETLRLSGLVEVSLAQYQQTNTTYYEKMKSIATPGNATSDDIVVQEQRAALENATVARSISRDSYVELVQLLAASNQTTLRKRCIFEIEKKVVASREERVRALEEAATDGSRVAEAVKIELATSSTVGASPKGAKRIERAQHKYEDGAEEVNELESVLEVLRMETGTEVAEEDQVLREKEASVLSSGEDRQVVLDALVVQHKKWVVKNETLLDEMVFMAKEIMKKSVESTEVERREEELNKLDMEAEKYYESVKRKKEKKQEMERKEREGDGEMEGKKESGKDVEENEKEREEEELHASMFKKKREVALVKLEEGKKGLELFVARQESDAEKQRKRVVTTKDMLASAEKAADVEKNRRRTTMGLIAKRKSVTTVSSAKATSTQRIRSISNSEKRLMLARNALRNEERDMFVAKKDTFAGEAERVRAMSDGDALVRNSEEKVRQASKVALEKCKEGGGGGAEEGSPELDKALSLLTRVVTKEHARAAAMLLTSSSSEGEGLKTNTTEGRSKESANFDRMVGRANSRKSRDCTAMAKLEELAGSLRSHLVEARSKATELSTTVYPAIGRSLRTSIINLEHQQTRVESAFILIRSKCKDSTSFARQMAEEAEVAAAMRAGRDETALLGNATLNSTNTSLPQ